ncbi:DUF917 domain-containing protein [Celeribacter indicus]|uniref:DUF917 domain-containing protein n=1 Tax=Celeribacter indicus TaxID=1208324 RepID=A0A0B5E0V3_9RHOB|nr:DUF917 domain-containing protein [Celeribacter indicus]AJE47045.1 hypothetical protein P73_2330 [Celeribacter indicus]SDW92235.1 hypothetical protein SAMN05443573_109106 [Celeribacter indicus]
MRLLQPEDLEDIAVGAAVLGTGGGGDPYIGKLLARGAIQSHGPVRLVSLEELQDDARVITCGAMGAPTIVLEKVPSGDEMLMALRHYEEVTGDRVTAIMPFEAGGLNSCLPIVLAAQTGLPLVDADGMGRAFPQLEMETFNVYGIAAAPMAMADEKGNLAMVRTRSASRAEFIARGLCIRMGGQASLVNYPMDGATAKRVSVPATMSLAQDIGKVLRRARKEKTDPLSDLIVFLRTTHYGHAERLGSGKVTDIERRVENGWSVGIVTISPFGEGMPYRIRIQNENLVVERGSDILAVVPDLICVLDVDTAEAIPTERLRYGQRVEILGVRVPPIMRSPAALKVFGPAAFGLSAKYQPLGGG